MDRYIEVSATPTLDTNIYASGDALHAAQMSFDVSALRDAGGLILDHVLIADGAKQQANLDLLLLNASTSNQTVNGAFALAAADVARIVAAVSLTTHFAFNATSLTAASDLARPIKLQRTQASFTLYGFLVARATPTYAANSLSVRLGFRPLPLS